MFGSSAAAITVLADTSAGRLHVSETTTGGFAGLDTVTIARCPALVSNLHNRHGVAQ